MCAGPFAIIILWPSSIKRLDHLLHIWYFPNSNWPRHFSSYCSFRDSWVRWSTLFEQKRNTLFCRSLSPVTYLFLGKSVKTTYHTFIKIPFLVSRILSLIKGTKVLKIYQLGSGDLIKVWPSNTNKYIRWFFSSVCTTKSD